jgi:enoyl-[acyl-carrier protein] reductase I
MENIINSKVLAGKKGLIMGVANNMSIGWAIAELVHQNGAELAFTFQGEALEKRVRPLAEGINSTIIEPCDVTDSESLKRLFDVIRQQWGKLDFIVHAIAFSDKEELRGRYINTSLKNFLNTMHISCYSLTEVARLAEDLMSEGGSILTLTYHGSTKVMPSYNVMGVAKAALEANVKYLAADLGFKNIRVNSVSAGPIKTLAASGIGDFRTMLKIHESVSPLKRNTTLADVAKSSLYLLSDLSSGVTGEIHYVDSGYSIMGMNLPEPAQASQG